jgi:ferredoxin-NADP reductase
MSMLRARAAASSVVPFRLVYSVREPGAAIYAAEIARLAAGDEGLEVAYIYTRAAPPGWTEPPGRLDATRLARAGWPPSRQPVCYVCGPTGFVEVAANLLVDAGHPAERVLTERFGPSGTG